MTTSVYPKIFNRVMAIRDLHLLPTAELFGVCKEVNSLACLFIIRCMNKIFLKSRLFLVYTCGSFIFVSVAKISNLLGDVSRN